MRLLRGAASALAMASAVVVVAGGQAVWIEDGARLRWAPRHGGSPQVLALPGVRLPLVMDSQGRRAMLRQRDAQGERVLVLALDAQGLPSVLHSLPAPDGALFFGPGQRRLVAIDGLTVHLYDLEADQALALEHPFPVNALEFSPDLTLLATACQDQFARLWDGRTGQLRAAPLAHQGAVLSVAFSSDGRALLSGSLDGTARLWSARTGQRLAEPMIVGGAVHAARLDAAGLRAVTVSKEAGVSFWRLPDSLPQQVRRQADGERLQDSAFLPDRGLLAVASVDGQIALWQADAADPAHGGRPGLKRLWLRRLAEPVSRLVLSPDGARVAVAAASGQVQLLDARDGALLGLRLRHRGTVAALQFSADSRVLHTGSTDGTARSFDAQTQQARDFPRAHPGEVVTRVQASADGQWLLTVGAGAQGKAVRVWSQAAQGAVALPQRIAQLAFVGFTSPLQFITVQDSEIVRWRLLPPDDSGRSLALVEEGRVELGSLVWTAELSPDATRLAISGLDGSTRLIDVATLRMQGDPMKGVGIVEALAFSSDGRWLLTRSAAGQLRVWDSRLGLPASDTSAAQADLQSAHLGASGAYWLTAGADGGLMAARLGLDFELPGPVWLAQLLALTGGGHLDASGAMTRISNRGESFQDLSGAISAEPVGAWARWGAMAASKLGPAPRGRP